MKSAQISDSTVWKAASSWLAGIVVAVCVVMPVWAQLTDSQVQAMRAKIRAALFVPEPLPALDADAPNLTPEQLSVLPMDEWECERKQFAYASWAAAAIADAKRASAGNCAAAGD